MAKTSTKIIQKVTERTGFEVEGKVYCFKGNIKKIIIPGKGKMTVEEILENEEICLDLVKGKSDLIEIVETQENESEEAK